MAKFLVLTTEEEQDLVIKFLKQRKGMVTSMSLIASNTHIVQGRVRYVLSDLIESGRIKRITQRSFGAHYARYSYEVVE